MKKWVILLLVFYSSILAQDFEPSSMTFTCTIGSTTYTDEEIDPELFKQDEILTGFIWNHSNKFVQQIKIRYNTKN